jgi:HPt (histidine-containing phosphotransfer) domain-containing protein
MRTAQQEILARIWQVDGSSLVPLADAITDCATAIDAGCSTGADMVALIQAASTAHRLAGTLGMFGHRELADLARDVEEELEAVGDGDYLDTDRLLRLSLQLSDGIRQATAGHRAG